MINPMPHASGESITDTMIELARCSIEDRIILAGSAEPCRILELRSRGYPRVVATATCKPSRDRYDVALVEWRQHSIKALETTLDWLVHFLSPTGVLVIWIDAAPAHRKLRSAIERLGFQAETATHCENGFAISARRLNVERTGHGGLGLVRLQMAPGGRGVRRVGENRHVSGRSSGLRMA